MFYSDIKEIATIYKPQRYEFFSTYSDALKDFVKQLEVDEKKKEEGTLNDTVDESNSTLNKSNKSSKSSKKNLPQEKFLVHGKNYNLDQVKELAAKEESDELKLINQERFEYSKNMIDVLLGPGLEVILIRDVNILIDFSTIFGLNFRLF